MITVKTNIGQVAASLQNKFKLIRNEAYVNDKLIRTLAADLAPMVANRIHGEGKKADGTQIGEYSNKYLSTRKRYNQAELTKVIFSLSRKMQNEFGVVASDKGYGLGFRDGGKEVTPKKGKPVKQITSKKKQEFLEERFGLVYGLTKQEKAQIQKSTDQFIKDVFG